MESEYDIVVVGSGTSGSTAAYMCREKGWRVAIIDSNPFGGTCALRGCDPKKVLIGFAEIIDSINNMEPNGVKAEGTVLEWKRMMQFKRSFTDMVPQNREKGFEKAGIDVFKGRSHFTGRNELTVGGKNLNARFFMIGAGAKPVPLKIPGAEYIKTSDYFLELDTLPERIVFVGGGYISFEFAHITRMAGAETIILHRSEHPLKKFDKDLVAGLLESMKEKGIDVRLNAPVVSVKKYNGYFIVEYTDRDSKKMVETDLVVHGAGRIPDISDMELDKANVECSDRGIKVNEFLQSVSNKRVYSAGDSADTPGMPLTPVASMEAGVASYNILNGNKIRPDYSGIPTVAFTLPPIASVGLNEAQALASGIEYELHSGDTSKWFTSRRVSLEHTGFKVLVDKKSEYVVGAHVFGYHADEIINIFALAIRNHIKASKLRNMVYSYPTASSDIGYMV